MVGRRQVFAVDLASRESRSSWRAFLLDLKQRSRGSGVRVSDDHPGLEAAILEVLTEVLWQRCYVHFPPNALRPATSACLGALTFLGRFS
mgnify:CR=1 FL=1|jgi:putative transposase